MLLLYVLVLSEKEKTQCLSLVRLVSNAQSARASILCIGGQTGGPARPDTGPAKHGPFRHDPLKHENINGSCRACPWAEVPAQARPEIDLIGPGRPVWPGSPKMFK